MIKELWEANKKAIKDASLDLLNKYGKENDVEELVKGITRF